MPSHRYNPPPQQQHGGPIAPSLEQAPGQQQGGMGGGDAPPVPAPPQPMAPYQYAPPQPPPPPPPPQYYGQPPQGPVPVPGTTPVYQTQPFPLEHQHMVPPQQQQPPPLPPPQQQFQQQQPQFQQQPPMQNQYLPPPQQYADGSVVAAPPPGGTGYMQPPVAVEEQAQPHPQQPPAPSRPQQPQHQLALPPPPRPQPHQAVRKSVSPSEAWETKFSELREFHAEFGHADVPQTYKKNRALGKWVGKQREHYKTLQESGQSPLTEDRIAKLATLNFKFQIGKGQHAKIHGFFMTDKLIGNWEERFKDLVAFKAEHGHCDVPVKFPQNKALGRWVAMQRRKFRSLEEKEINTTPASMLESRVQRLRDLGFKFQIGRGDYVRTSKKSGDGSGTITSHDAIWEERLRALEAYKTEHGTCDVPVSYKGDPKLASWVAKQRELWRNRRDNRGGRKLTDERVAKLEALGFHFRAYEASWEAKLAELREYKAKYGTANVTQVGTKPTNALWHWSKRQRDCFKDFLEGKPGPMTHERIRQLEELGFDWKYIDTVAKTTDKAKKSRKTPSKSKEKSTDVGVESKEGKESAIENGEGLPVLDSTNDTSEETEKQSRGEGDCARALSTDRNTADDANTSSVAIGSTFNAANVQVPPMPNLDSVANSVAFPNPVDNLLSDKSMKKGTKPEKWLRNYEELVAYKARHGHTRVPCRSKEYPKLGCWVKLQREDYRKMKNKKVTPMCEWRRQLLEKIGFEWRLAPSCGPTPWEERFAALEEFKREHGHCNVPQAYPKDVPLGKWVSKQRDFFRFLKEGKPSRLDAEKISKMESIGFQWYVGKGKGLRNWNDYFEDCKAFKAKYGHCNIPLGYEESPALGTWANQQRKNFKKVQNGKAQNKNYLLEHIRLLESIDFNFHAVGEILPKKGNGEMPKKMKGKKKSKQKKTGGEKRGRPRKNHDESSDCEERKDDDERPRKRGRPRKIAEEKAEIQLKKAEDEEADEGDGEKTDNEKVNVAYL